MCICDCLHSMCASTSHMYYLNMYTPEIYMQQPYSNTHRYIPVHVTARTLLLQGVVFTRCMGTRPRAEHKAVQKLKSGSFKHHRVLFFVCLKNPGHGVDSCGVSKRELYHCAAALRPRSRQEISALFFWLRWGSMGSETWAHDASLPPRRALVRDRVTRANCSSATAVWFDAGVHCGLQGRYTSNPETWKEAT